MRNWLTAGYGEGNVYYDYGDLPLDPSSPSNVDPEGFLRRSVSQFASLHAYRAVHGHFWSKKYESLPGAIHATFLREPVERLLSHYFFWMQIPRSGNLLHNYVQDNRLSWSEFAHLPSIRNLYSGVFFRGFNMRHLSFIGDCSRMETEMLRFGRFLGLENGTLGRDNATAGEYRDQVAQILCEQKNVHLLRSLLADDIEFYERFAGS